MTEQLQTSEQVCPTSQKRHKKRILNGYSGLAIGSALISFPLAFLDVYFLRLAVSYLANAPENDPLIWAASGALSLVALALAALAGRFFEEHDRISRPITIVLGAFWLLFGIIFFVVRIFAELNLGQEFYVAVIMSAVFLLVFLADGVLGFLAGREILNPHLHEYLRAKKQVKQLEAFCLKNAGNVRKTLGLMRQIEAQKQTLLDNMREINRHYYSESVPARMISVVRELREKDLVFFNSDDLWRKIGYDPITRRPAVANNRSLFENRQDNQQ